MIKKIRRFLPIFILFFWLFPTKVFADVGTTDIYPQGGFLWSSNTNTSISMEYEKVVLTYKNPAKTEWGFENYMSGHVSAVFKMLNNSSTTESIKMFFPADDGYFVGIIPILAEQGFDNFKMNGQMFEDKEITSIEYAGKSIRGYQWIEEFSPGVEKQITVEYDIKTKKAYGYFLLTYILGTGNTWKGSIKEGEIVFVLPEKLETYSLVERNEMNRIIFNQEISDRKSTAIPYVISGNTVTFRFKNYKPETWESNFFGGL